MNSYQAVGHKVPHRFHVFPGLSAQETGEPDAEAAPKHEHLKCGIMLYAQGQTQKALWDFFESVAARPGDVLGHYLCGVALQALGLEQEAQVEWETVVALTARAEAEPDMEALWACRMARRLLGTGTEGPVQSQRIQSQESLEEAILAAVRRHGGCYVKDNLIAGRLHAASEEQIVGWKQSFCARKGLECRPCQATGSRESCRDGVFFKRCCER